jgi:adenine-specific DNA-methyltransferase
MTEINFKGKEFVYNHHLAVPFRPLVPDESKGVGPVALDGSLVVHGDNLHALKALLPLYAGKVDCVFIDPPYNTGNEGWCYNDNVNAPMIREWFQSNPVGIEDGLRHDKWCAMMWPRLRLLHELLADTGSFWMTLDDNEAHRGKLMLDEIFGEENFVGDVSWKHTEQSKNDEKHFSRNKNTLLVYRKSESCLPFRFERTEADNKNYSNPDRDNKGPWRSGDVRSPSLRKTLQYELTTPSGKTIEPPENGWRWSKDVLEDKISTREITFVDNETRIFRKIYLADQTGRTPENLWSGGRFGNTRGASRQLSEIFGDDPFETKKPIELIQRIMEAASLENGLILDSFAGSGTTAHAVLDANNRDGGHRRFILVELEDYADRVTAERVRRVIEGYSFTGTQKRELLRERITWTKFKKAEKLLESVGKLEEKHAAEYDEIKKTIKNGELVVIGEKAVAERAKGLGGGFTYCTLGDPVELDKVLSGETLPSFEGLGSVLFHMATARAFNPAHVRPDDFYLGKTEGQHVWLIYKPDLDWLKSPDAALTLKAAKEIAATDPDASHLVFAPARYVSQKMLVEQNIPVEFVPLPFALYRIDRS